MKTIIQCGSLIDGTGADPLERSALVIEDGAIVAIDRNGGGHRDADQVIDATRQTVMPGMIDCHVHLAMNAESIQETLLAPYSLLIARMLANARLTLECGFTSVRDAGGTPRGVKLAIERKLFPGPRLRIAVNFLSQTGGHGDFTLPAGVNYWPTTTERPSGVVDGIEGAHRVAREMLRAGADQLKLMTSGGVLSPSDEPGATGFSPEEIAVFVREARAAGKPTMAHAQGTQGIKNAVRAGIDSIEHGMYLDEEAAEEMQERGTYFVPTLLAPLSVVRRAEADPSSVPPYAVRKAHEVIKTHRASFRLALEKGVRIAMGTDMGVGPHGGNAEELWLMVEAGMSPMQAIVATTKTAAECCRLDHLAGTLEVGKRADLLAVAGDPLADIAILQDRENLALIMQDGECVKNTLGSGVPQIA